MACGEECDSHASMHHVLTADGETPDAQVDLGPAQRNGLPAAQPGVGDKCSRRNKSGKLVTCV